MSRTGALLGAACLLAAALPQAADSIAPLAPRLADTGLYRPGTLEIADGLLAFSPQYTLWADGASKRRWLYLPPGAVIDARNPDAWVFPPGVRLWKEFRYDRAVETRLIERLADGSWRFSVYVWNAGGTDATLASEFGIKTLPVAAAPGGRYVVPSRTDCIACHEGGAVPVLGFSALQLSTDRDEAAAHAEPLREDDVTLTGLAERGLLVNLPPALLTSPPRGAGRTPAERAALGYLHANCGHCHNDGGAIDLVALNLSMTVAGELSPILTTLLDVPSEKRVFGFDRRVVAGNAPASVLALRMRSRDPHLQMPPLGTRLVDRDGLALVEAWINQLDANLQEIVP